MNYWVASSVVAVFTAASVTLMFVVRRGAPAGGFFNDSDRGSNVFAVIGTSFTVLVAFVMFLAFESYSEAKADAGHEAVAVTQLFHTAALFSPPVSSDLQGQLICYGRAVSVDEWRTMRHGRHSPLVQDWLEELERSGARLQLMDEKQSVAYGDWLDDAGERFEGRRGRIAEATPVVPPPLWFVLILGACVVVAFMLLFADPNEPLFVQAAMIGTVTTMLVSSLLVVHFLDRPYGNRSGSIQPVEMERTLALIEPGQETLGRLSVPCDRDGRPLPA